MAFISLAGLNTLSNIRLENAIKARNNLIAEQEEIIISLEQQIKSIEKEMKRKCVHLGWSFVTMSDRFEGTSQLKSFSSNYNLIFVAASRSLQICTKSARQSNIWYLWHCTTTHGSPATVLPHMVALPLYYYT